MSLEAMDFIKLILPIAAVTVGSIMSFILGLLAWWIKNLASDVKTSSKELAELKGVVMVLDLRSKPIPEMEKDLNAFHDWKRSVERDFKRNQ